MKKGIWNVRQLVEVLGLTEENKNLPEALPEGVVLHESLKEGEVGDEIPYDPKNGGLRVVLFGKELRLLKRETAEQFVLYMNSRGGRFEVLTLAVALDKHFYFTKKTSEMREKWESKCLDRFGSDESPWMDLPAFADRDIEVHLVDMGVPSEAISAFHNAREPFEEAFLASIAGENEPEDVRDFLRRLTEFKREYAKPAVEDERGRQVPYLKTQAIFRAFGKDRLGELRMFYLLAGQHEVDTIQEIHSEMDPPKSVEVREAYSCWLTARFLLAEKRRKESFIATDDGKALASRFEDAVEADREERRERFHDRGRRRDNDRNANGRGQRRQRNGWKGNESRPERDEE